MKSRRKRRFSARKTRKSGVSPHRARKEKTVSPQVHTDTKKTPDDEFLLTCIGHAENYTSAFINAGDVFWKRIESLRQTQGGTIKKRLKKGRKVLIRVPWLANRAKYLFTQKFVLEFVDSVRDRAFPKSRKSRARFLGDSLGMDGATSARRSRDIVGKGRARQQRESNRPDAEFYIRCCGKARWTVKRECPKCGRSPFPLQLPF